MRAVVCREAGGPEVLEVREVPEPTPGARRGRHRHRGCRRQPGRPSAAPGALSPAARGESTSSDSSAPARSARRRRGRPLAGGRPGVRAAHQRRVRRQGRGPAGQVLPVPAGLDVVEAAALPEVVCTVWSNVFMLAALQPDETLLVHGGAAASGPWPSSSRTHSARGLRRPSARSEKAALCRELGADLAVNYREQDFVEEVRRLDDSGADVILDNMGAEVPRPQRRACSPPRAASS